MKVKNPIVRGFYPDPSICEANGKYYLACSTFQFFPGVPIFESEDLINWKQVGSCLTRLSQIELNKIPSSGGVYAPTLRYHDGTFYMVTNNNTANKNFYITTTDITGEWSEPIFVDQEGIDPSLFFDNGKVYFTSNGPYVDAGRILQCEIDIKTGEKLTESTCIWTGSGGRYIESPHLYHIGEYYYLMVAEGGTEYGHMITYARSKNPFGPFEGYEKNPVLTNRNLGGFQSIVQGIGHGDLIQDKNGDWYIVCLGFRQNGIWSPYHHLGREVFLSPVTMGEDGWFTAGKDGQVHEEMEVSIETTMPAEDLYDVSFEKTPLSDFRWTYLRDYHKENYSFEDNKLTLKGTSVTLDEADTPTFVSVRQSEFDTDLTVTVTSEASEAGITYYMDEDAHYDLYLKRENGESSVELRLHIGDVIQIKKKIRIDGDSNKAKLHIVSDRDKYYFYVCSEGGEICLGEARCKYLSSEVAGGFTGVMMGLYAVDENGKAAVFENLLWKQRH